MAGMPRPYNTYTMGRQMHNHLVNEGLPGNV